MKRIVAAVTGSRAEYGLLKPVMKAISAHSGLELRVIVTGTHLLKPQETINEVARDFAIAATVPMQINGGCSRAADAGALARGCTGFAELLTKVAPDFVLVLGDRIEAFAAASVAAVAGIRVAHMHGGDRAQGVADESLRHAISKLAHVHLPATATSAQRLIAMGEEPSRVHIVGSPAIDGLAEIPPLSDQEYQSLGKPQIIVLLHPIGDDEQIEFERASRLIAIAQKVAPTLVLYPNHDPGRSGIVRAIVGSKCTAIEHLSRDQFIGLMQRIKVIVGNSSAGLIECAALSKRCVNLGLRQAGREMPLNVVNIPSFDEHAIDKALREGLILPLSKVDHPYGSGQTGRRVAELLATVDLNTHRLAKRNTY